MLTPKKSSRSTGVVRAPVLSKLGVLYTEELALESETAKEHIPVDNQIDYTKNPFGQRVLECLTVSPLIFSLHLFVN